MVDQEAMFQVNNYLNNHGNFWNTTFTDYRFWIIIGGLGVIGIITWFWLKKKKGEKDEN